MADNLSYIWSKVPFYLQTERNKQFLESIALELDKAEELLDSLDKMWLINSTVYDGLPDVFEEFRKDIASFVGVDFQSLTTLNQTRRLKAYYYAVFYANTLTNLLDFIYLTTNYYPDSVSFPYGSSPDDFYKTRLDYTDGTFAHLNYQIVNDRVQRLTASGCAIDVYVAT